VTHTGDDSGGGEWHCMTDRGTRCAHLTIARHYLQKLVQMDPTARDDSAHHNESETTTVESPTLGALRVECHPLPSLDLTCLNVSSTCTQCSYES
ncbi:hypothetical protein PLICRDRAFT_100164, partial [Plicaturopsis crispa FD-325 SS-3]